MIAAAAVEEITTTMDADAEADMETIMDSLAILVVILTSFIIYMLW